MNKWFRRTVGTVGIAGGILLLGAGAAHADDSPVKDPQQLNGLFDEILTPAGGPNNLGLSLDSPDRKVSTGLVPGGPVATAPHAHRGQAGLTAHTPRRSGLPNDPFVTAPIPDVMRSLPITDATGTSGLSGLAPGTESAFDSGAARLPLVET